MPFPLQMFKINIMELGVLNTNKAMVQFNTWNIVLLFYLLNLRGKRQDNHVGQDLDIEEISDFYILKLENSYDHMLVSKQSGNKLLLSLLDSL